MFKFIKKMFSKEPTALERMIAKKNQKEIIDKMEAYYRDLQNGTIDFHPRYLAIQDFWSAKHSGRLDDLNRIKKVGA